ncbi:hypothetical protein C8Q80DRAFT_477916 [Daedaleopsis nitida]|nr:hypothetical protein C8Q80DRAFT_477916 [Daedaleopsis nitida]
MLISIDKALRDLSKVLTDVNNLLRRHRNSLISINTMPDEILLPILTAAIPDPKTKTSVMRTCTRWLDLCLSSPRFWTESTLPGTKRGIIKYLRKTAVVVLVLAIDCHRFGDENQTAFWRLRPRVRQLPLLNLSLVPQNTEWLIRSWPSEVRTLLNAQRRRDRTFKLGRLPRHPSALQ